MNRRHKIIISVTSITLVLLILVGLTYAYFLTRIQGNTNEKSISVTTANLLVVYKDGDNEVVKVENIKPGKEIGTKEFTVTNEGDLETEYVVVIDNVSITKKRTEEETTFNSNDFVYTLECSSSNPEKTCEGQKEETMFPITNDGILIGNQIDVDEVQSYTLKVKYKETGIDQSKDMDKKLEARVNINNFKEVNPYKNNQDSLAYNIINNAKNNINGTELKMIPETTPLIQTSAVYKYDKIGKEDTNSIDISVSSTYQAYYWTYGTGYTVSEKTGKFTLTDVHTCQYNDGSCNKNLIGKYLVSNDAYYNSNSSNTSKTTKNLTYIYKVTEAPESSISNINIQVNKVRAIPIDYESELSITSDDYGISYYYRGNVEDNYVEFASMCWRVVRIQGDGSIKLILASEKTCNAEGSLTDSSGYATDKNAALQWYDYGYKKVNGYSINDYIHHGGRTTGGARNVLNEWLRRKIGEESSEYKKIKMDDWCIGDSTTAYDYNRTGQIVGTVNDMINNSKEFYYAAGNRYYITKTPKIRCETTGTEGEIDINNIGMLTVDEVAFAGGGQSGSGDSNYYLSQYAQVRGWWTLSPTFFVNDIIYRDQAFFIGINGEVGHARNDTGSAWLRPVITLVSDIEISEGNGTLESPYKIN